MISFLEGKQRALDGIQFAWENDVVLQVFCDRLRNGRGLLINLPVHGMRKFTARWALGEGAFR